jgi:hypothetical protein
VLCCYQYETDSEVIRVFRHWAGGLYSKCLSYENTVQKDADIHSWLDQVAGGIKIAFGSDRTTNSAIFSASLAHGWYV